MIPHVLYFFPQKRCLNITVIEITSLPSTNFCLSAFFSAISELKSQITALFQISESPLFSMPYTSPENLEVYLKRIARAKSLLVSVNRLSDSVL